MIPITLVSDFDQLRDHWVKKPLEYLTGVHMAPDGSAAVFTARGEVFTLPSKTGRIVKVAGNPGSATARRDICRTARASLPCRRRPARRSSGSIPRTARARPSNGRMMLRCCGGKAFLRPMARGWRIAIRSAAVALRRQEETAEADCAVDGGRFCRSDVVAGQPLARYLEPATNMFTQIKVLNMNTGEIDTFTSDRTTASVRTGARMGNGSTFCPTATLKTTVRSPWGARQPDPQL